MSPHSLWHHKQQALADGRIEPQAAPISAENLWTSAFAKIWLLNLTVYGWAFMVGAAFPFYIKHLGGTEMLVGITGAGFAACSLIMRPVAGWVLDNKSRQALLKIGFAVAAIISLLLLLSPPLALVVALRLLTGFAFSGIGTSCNTNACDIIPKSRFGEGIGIMGLGNTFATALGPALGLIIMVRYGFSVLFIASAGLVLLAAWLSRGLDYKKIQQQAYLPGRRHVKISDLFNADALPACAVTLFAAVPYGGVSAFIALYGDFSGLGGGGLFFILVAVGTGSTRLVSGRLADKKGEQPLLVMGNICFILALLMLLMHNSACYYLSGLFFGWGFGLTTPAMQSMAIRIVPDQRRGSASSTFLCAYDIGSSLGALAAGWLVTNWGYQSMFGTMGISIIISSLIYVLWASKTPSAFKNYQRALAAQERG